MDYGFSLTHIPCTLGPFIFTIHTLLFSSLSALLNNNSLTSPAEILRQIHTLTRRSPRQAHPSVTCCELVKAWSRFFECCSMVCDTAFSPCFAHTGETQAATMIEWMNISPTSVINLTGSSALWAVPRCTQGWRDLLYYAVLSASLMTEK